MKNLFFAIFTVVLFIGCSDSNEEVTPSGTKKILMATEVNSTNAETFNFQYNGDGLLDKITFNDGGSNWDLFYNGDNLLIQYDDYLYSYDDQGSRTESRWSGSSNNQSSFEHLSNGIIIESSSTQPSKELQYTNGNLIRESWIGSDGLKTGTELTYTYDNSPNVYGTLQLFTLTGYFDPAHERGLPPSKNNVTSEKYVEYTNGSLTYERITNYEFIYDDDGYPTACLVDGVTTWQYEYVK